MHYFQSKAPVSIGICDDMPDILHRMEQITRECLSDDYYPEIFCCTNPQELLSANRDFRIIILDIQLERTNGINIARQLLLSNPSLQLIFVTSYIEYISDVYDLPHLCLILKNQLDRQLPKFLHRAVDESLLLAKGRLHILARGHKTELSLDRLCFLERREHTTFLHLQNGEILQTREKLELLLNQDSSNRLLRCHVSYAVNLQHVSRLEEQCFRLYTAEQVPISRAYFKNARAAFFHYLQNHI